MDTQLGQSMVMKNGTTFSQTPNICQIIPYP